MQIQAPSRWYNSMQHLRHSMHVQLATKFCKRVLQCMTSITCRRYSQMAYMIAVEPAADDAISLHSTHVLLPRWDRKRKCKQLHYGTNFNAEGQVSTNILSAAISQEGTGAGTGVGGKGAMQVGWGHLLLQTHVVHMGVGLIHNLLLQQLLNDILNSDDAHRWGPLLSGKRCRA